MRMSVEIKFIIAGWVQQPEALHNSLLGFKRVHLLLPDRGTNLYPIVLECYKKLDPIGNFKAIIVLKYLAEKNKFFY